MKEDFQRLIEKVERIKEVERAEALLYSQIETPKLREAVEFGKRLHEGQFRKSGEPYIIHPILVAVIATYFAPTEPVAIASILHDVVEDNPEVSVYDIRNRFGEEVANLVTGLTKISALSKEVGGEEGKRLKNALNFRGLLLHSIIDARVLLIKLADRLHNMLTLKVMRADKQRRIAEETLVIYAPIAHRLGIATLKNILEDLAFKYLLPEEYQKIESYLKANWEKFRVRLNHLISEIKPKLEREGLTLFQIKGRIKHKYSIYQKMQRKGISIEEVLDLLAVRIILTGRPLDCYRALGVVHLNARPLIFRFKDYIALPKENGYQTLHTTVYDGHSIIEVQIRTKEMDDQAEFGVAAHWKYKEGGNFKLPWLEEIGGAGMEEDVEDFYELVKNDLYSEDIVVYTPKGDTITLPRGATLLDFAYKIHTEIGDRAVEGYLNNERVPLLTELRTGNVVKIVTGEKPIPRCSWIELLKTSKAKIAQRKLCRKREQQLAEKVGWAILNGIFDVDSRLLRIGVKKGGLCKQIPKIPFDRKVLEQVVRQIYPIIRKYRPFYFRNIQLREVQLGKFRFYTNRQIEGVNFSYCCHPKFGDRIIGILDEKGRGAEIHHFFCSEGEKRLEKGVYLEWYEERENRYELVVNLENRWGELAKFINFLTSRQAFINNLELSEETNNCKVEITIDSKKVEGLKKKLGERYRVLQFTSKKDAYNG
ncbi:MAG: RelA/SpoT family protein [Campylobacterales bacterium]